MTPRLIISAFLVVSGLYPILAESPSASAAAPSGELTFTNSIRPLLDQYCFDCHGDGTKKGGVALDIYPDVAAMSRDRKTWEHVLHNLSSHVMPPEKKPQPTLEERELLVAWIETEIFKTDCDHPDPGRVTLRRLNRTEYNLTIRDLVGVDFRPADDFPADDSGHGFDNIGDALSLPPVLLEKYLSAAEKIVDAALVSDPSTNGPVKRIEAEKMESTAVGGPYGTSMGLHREGEVFQTVSFKAGEYLLRARAFGQQAGTEPPRLEFRIDGAAVATVDVKAVESHPEIYETRVNVASGDKRFAAAYINNYVNEKDPNPDSRDRNLYIDYLELVGPIDREALPASHQSILGKRAEGMTDLDYARDVIRRFARRAFRRPVTDGEVVRLSRFVDLAKAEGESLEKGIKLALQATLVSPHFLFRGELQPEPNNPQSVHDINEHALASRLSYFLWSTMPDDALLDEADRGTLRQNLDPLVHRMIQSPKSRALIENFVGQWLQIRNLELVSPDVEEFPDFDDELRQAMKTETEMFVEALIREDRSVLELVSADFTYLNERLARHYGIDSVRGKEFQRVSLRGTPRGGILTQASILTITSNPTRTSPVKRGKWILENILGTPPPPPPPEVPDLKEGKEAVSSGTLRQRMEQHRANPSCASCHARMDPIGFSFENFNGIGRWRERDGRFPIDPAGKLTSGQSFEDPAELRRILVTGKRDEFVRCLIDRTLTYSLGRGLEYYDKCAVEQIAKGMAKQNYRFSSLITEIVKSTPFQKRRGEGDRLAQSAP